MSGKNDGGDKTEKPTPKRLQDARKKGDVAKSRDVTSAIGLIVWLVLASLATGYVATRIGLLYELLFDTIEHGWKSTGFAGAARAIGAQSAEVAVMAVAMLVLPVAAVAVLTDFLQVGPVFAFDRVKPKLDGMNPVEGVKRMFSLDNLIEVMKAALKAAFLVVLGWLIVRSSLPDMISLARSTTVAPQVVGGMLYALTIKLLGAAVALFAFLSILDWAYQKWSFEKKMRMSIADIKKEVKESEGDPHIKGKRKQLGQELTQQNNAQAARNANVLLVNPTHIAIAIEYDRETCPVPMIAAKGEEEVAAMMREAARDAGVPILRNIPLARDLFARGEVGEIVPGDLFGVIAEVILWAREVRTDLEAQRRGEWVAPTSETPRAKAPGEDMTFYPEAPWNPSH